MKSENILIALSVCAFFVVIADFIHASSPASNHTKSQTSNRIDPEKKATLNKIYAESQKRLRLLRNELFTKNIELERLKKTPSTPPATIANKKKEITALQTQIRTEHESTESHIAKVTSTGKIPVKHYYTGRSGRTEVFCDVFSHTNYAPYDTFTNNRSAVSHPYGLHRHRRFGGESHI